MLHLARLTDRPGVGEKENLTIKRLPALIMDAELRKDVRRLVKSADDATRFARDWRNRRIAHQDLKLALGQGARPLAPASRASVKQALAATAQVIRRISVFYMKTDIAFDHSIGPVEDGVQLLYLIWDGLEARGNRDQRFRSGKHTNEDLKPPPEI